MAGSKHAAGRAQKVQAIKHADGIGATDLAREAANEEASRMIELMFMQIDSNLDAAERRTQHLTAQRA